MRTISETRYTKTSKNAWEKKFYTEDVFEVYKDLSNDLIHKKLHNCSYITRITDESNYDGTRTITAYYTDGVKGVYIVAN